MDSSKSTFRSSTGRNLALDLALFFRQIKEHQDLVAKTAKDGHRLALMRCDFRKHPAPFIKEPPFSRMVFKNCVILDFIEFLNLMKMKTAEIFFHISST